MGVTASPRRRSMGGAIVLILVGLVLLYVNFRPDLDPWPILSRYWPLILIFAGLGRLWDYHRVKNHPEAASGISGRAVAWIVLLGLFGVALVRERRTPRYTAHETQTVERQGAQSVRATINIPAGNLDIAGGASKLLEADFDYSEAEGRPQVEYNVAGDVGQLRVSQRGRSVHMGRTHNSWELRLSNDVPMDLRVEMGAGQGDLRLRGTSLERLDVKVGAGQLTVDLTEDWKKNLQANIEGGVGEATIRLPKDVGVRVHATGGIGSINVRGLRHEGEEYVNDAYGKSPVTLRVSVEGGVGQINLE